MCNIVDENWKDLLTSYDGQTITYDAQGNPLNYLGHTLTWEKGRQLKSFDNIQYTYNANGIRTSKTVGDVCHNYVLDGVNIIEESWNGNTLRPIYDNEETVCGIFYNGEPFYFHKNLQGDIIAILDKNASTVAKYSYDAWGVCTITQDTSNCAIATINPYRYRSYYYDEDIQMYYLQSRYYNPVVSRFVNGDKARILGAGINISAYNLYTYCCNNPTNHIDFNGMFIAQVVTALIGAVIGAAGYLVGFFIEKYFINNKAKFNVWELVASIVIGAIDGILSCLKIGKLISFALNFMAEFISSITGKDNIYEALICAFIVAILSLCLSGGMSFKKISKYNIQFISKLKKNNWKIIKEGIKTFFKHIKQHLKKYMSNSFFVAMFGVSMHSISKKTIMQTAKGY